MEIQIHIDDISWICHICLRNFLYKTKIGVMDLKKIRSSRITVLKGGKARRNYGREMVPVPVARPRKTQHKIVNLVRCHQDQAGWLGYLGWLNYCSYCHSRMSIGVQNFCPSSFRPCVDLSLSMGHLTALATTITSHLVVSNRPPGSSWIDLASNCSDTAF